MDINYLKEASKLSDGFTEPHPLWEYPCYPLSDVHELFNIDIGGEIDEKIFNLNNIIKLTRYNFILNNKQLNYFFLQNIILAFIFVKFE